jgi:hypothetical protein
MAYRWKPSKKQKREFADKMNSNYEFALAYYNRKLNRSENNIKDSKFDYSIAGGNYIPTQIQYQNALHFILNKCITHEEKEACEMVISGYTLNDKIHHDFIHIVNELYRKIN